MRHFKSSEVGVVNGTCVETCIGWQNGLASSPKSQKIITKSGATKFNDHALFHAFNLGATQLTCIDLSGASKRCETSVNLRANSISTKVSSSHGRSTQEQASPGQTDSQVDLSFLLRLPASMFGRGFRDCLKKRNKKNILLLV